MILFPAKDEIKFVNKLLEIIYIKYFNRNFSFDIQINMMRFIIFIF